MQKEQLIALATEYAKDKLRPIGATNHFLAGYAACEQRFADLLAAAEAIIKSADLQNWNVVNIADLRTALTNLKAK